MKTVCFYLLTAAVSTSDDFAVLPAALTFGAGTYALAVLYAEPAQHATFAAGNPQPVGWTGTVADARAVLRGNDMITSWWVFDQFASARGVATNEQFSSV